METATTIPLDKEVWEIAAVVVLHKPSDAVGYAEQRALQALEEKDALNYTIWLAVKRAVVELTRLPEDGENVN
jgi:hypothetical protein